MILRRYELSGLGQLVLNPLPNGQFQDTRTGQIYSSDGAMKLVSQGKATMASQDGHGESRVTISRSRPKTSLWAYVVAAAGVAAVGGAIWTYTKRAS